MKKFIYYLRLLTFTLYLIVMFILIEEFYKPDIVRFIFYTLSIIYAITSILSILSKKDIFKSMISFNILNISFYTYLFIIFIVTFNSTRFDILNNEIYFRNNLILISIFYVILILFNLSLNKEDDN